VIERAMMKMQGSNALAGASASTGGSGVPPDDDQQPGTGTGGPGTDPNAPDTPDTPDPPTEEPDVTDWNDGVPPYPGWVWDPAQGMWIDPETYGPGTGGEEEVPWDVMDIIKLLSHRLNQPSAFDDTAIKEMREFFKQEREAERLQKTADLETDAASRGVFYGTPLTAGMANMEADLSRSEAAHDAELTRFSTTLQQQAMDTAINQAMSFLQFMSDERHNEFIRNFMAGQQGEAGGPSFESVLRWFAGLPGGEAPTNPEDWEWLTTLWPDLFGGQSGSNEPRNED
jgi:hypothetical protein